MKAQHKRYFHSKTNARNGTALLQALKIQLFVHLVPFTIRNPDTAYIEAFKWETGQNGVLLEEKQRQRYLKKSHDILSVNISGKNIELVGSTDLLIMSADVKEFPHCVDLLPDVRMLIEVKRPDKIIKGAFYQTISELIALDYRANGLVVALLTDATSYWQFFWVSNKSNDHVSIKNVTLTQPSAAFAIIRAILTQSPKAHEISLPWLGEPAKPHKLRQLWRK
ncbi:hypothetical protein V7S43_013829 [Phytophthora oleae]|uniref:YqaJ viral recombinase domain-containing protein n=1 Tax=Phytophthora oleae TaxID=2107226 RepID=A0ABD3F5C5_9STRA